MALNEIRRSQTEYKLDQGYLDRHIVGLVSSQKVYDTTAAQWVSKVTYDYDAASPQSPPTNPVQHNESYDLAYRGNLTSVSRWDVTQPDINNPTLTSHTTYDTAGSVLTITDAAGHQTSL